MTLQTNDGSRNSRLALGRLASGELEEGALGELSDHDRTVLAEIASARADVRPLAVAALRNRAARIDAVPVPLPAPANRSGAWAWAVPLIAMAAALLVAVLPGLTGPGGDDYIGVRGGDTLTAYDLRDGQLHPYEGRALGEGDVLGFKVRSPAHTEVVVLSVDGEGRVKVFWPADGTTPERLDAEGPVALPGSVILDGARGPEIFLAFFDTPAATAREEARRAWQSGGTPAVAELAARSDVASVTVERR